MSARRRRVFPGPLGRVAAMPWPPMEVWIVKLEKVERCLAMAAAVLDSWKESSGWAWKCLSFGLVRKGDGEGRVWLDFGEVG